MNVQESQLNSGRVSAAAGSDLDIVLASRLARASTAEPYWKQRANRTPADGAEVAKLKKQLSELSKDFHALLGVHEKSDASLQDVQGKIKLLRQELASKEKQLDLCRRTVDRLTEEKAHSEGSTAADKAYIRKLESRLLSVKNAVELQSKCIEYRAQAEDMAHQLRLAESRAASAEEAVQRQKQEEAFLKRGIELAAEQLTKSSGSEVPTTLLMAVARAQEDGMAMSVQLADRKHQLAQMASALQHARAHLLEQQKTLEELQEQTHEQSHTLRSTHAELESERVTAAELRHISASLKQHVSKLKEERDALRHHIELERTATSTAEEKIQELEAALLEQSRVEGSLRSQLRQLQGVYKEHKQQQQHLTMQNAVPRKNAAGKPANKRPAAPTPNRGSGAAKQASPSPSNSASRPADRPIQRLRQQQTRRLAHPVPAQPRAASSLANPTRPQQAVLDAQRQEHALISTEEERQGQAHVPDAQEAPRPTQHQPVGDHGLRKEGLHQNVRLADLYVSALDEQIAMIEGDLAGLSASCSPTRLQQALQGFHRSAEGQAEAQPHQRPGQLQPRNAEVGIPASPASGRGTAGVANAPSKNAERSVAQPRAGSKSGAPGAAETKQTPSKSPAGRFPEPSPSKLLQPGWLAGQHSVPTSPVIGAWRPNSTFEPVDADAVVLQASMSEHTAMLFNKDLARGSGRPSAKAQRPAALIVPNGAHDRYSDEVLGESSTEDGQPDSEREASPHEPSSAGSACPQEAASQAPSPGLVWHSNPLAQTTPDIMKAPTPPAACGDVPMGRGASDQSKEFASQSKELAAQKPSSGPSSGGKVRPTNEQSTQEAPAPPSTVAAGSASVWLQQDHMQQEQPEVDPMRADTGSRVRRAEPTLSDEVSWEWQRGPIPPPTQQRMQRSPDGQPCARLMPRQQAAQDPSWWTGDHAHPHHDKAQRRDTVPSHHTQQQWELANDGGEFGSQQSATQDAEDGKCGGVPHQQQPTRRNPSAMAAMAHSDSRAGQAGSPGMFPGGLRWSVASGASSWLNTAYEPDIEQLEVKSQRKPARAQLPESREARLDAQQQLQVGGRPREACSAAPASARVEPTLATLFELATMDLDCM